MNGNESLIRQFTEAAQSVTAVVVRVPADAEAVNQAILYAASGETEILFAEPEFLPQDLFSVFRKHPGVIVNPTDEQLKTIKTGVTEAFAGVARTGSICVPVNRNLSGSISLFTRKHIAVLRADTIIPQPRDVFSIKDPIVKGWLHNFVFITGSSATADMGPLVRGVHGPGALHIIVI